MKTTKKPMSTKTIKNRHSKEDVNKWEKKFDNYFREASVVDLYNLKEIVKEELEKAYLQGYKDGQNKEKIEYYVEEA